ncbi:MAG TPA: hypothetical protein VGB54_15315 [Allosphingosinicella sp.]
MTVLLLELNEINFDYVLAYSRKGSLPTLARLVERHGLVETESEQRYEELEPWIQWVTAHTGKTLAEHGVFRLGDIVDHPELEQIWEALEQQGLKVGAMSPMNADNRCADPAFFIPDPWTRTRLSGPAMMRRLYDPVAQAVNDNAAGRLSPSTIAKLVAGIATYARPANYRRYLGLAAGAARKAPWSKAMFLDLLLADLFIKGMAAKRPDFASLFLNAGAHIQHHYMFNSSVYDGPHANPGWYVSPDVDPVLEVYSLYDRIVAQVIGAFPQARVMIATGLHQDPHPDLTFYWRLRDHEAFLRDLGASFARVEARMSRDFVVYCREAAEAASLEARLAAVLSDDGAPLFEVDNRGDSLFVTLSWPHDIPDDFEHRVDGAARRGLRKDVAFVAVKNGGHNGTGYFIDTGISAAQAGARFPLKTLPDRIAAALGAQSLATLLRPAAE